MYAPVTTAELFNFFSVQVLFAPDFDSATMHGSNRVNRRATVCLLFF
jgi:hypothetical protein